jgi:catecholate siderophore receptor
MFKFQKRPLAAAICVLFSAPQYLHAQATKEQTLPEVRVRGAQDGFKTESTNSGTRTDTPLRDIPQFINTVPQELIRSQGATSLVEALRNVPGISYAAAEGGTQANQVFYLRGFPAGGDLFLDGVRDIGEYNRDLFNTESVEVLKGPSALMYGRGSTGGLINQVTKAPGLLGHKELSLTLGSFNQKRLVGDINVKTGDDQAFRLVALLEGSNSYRYPQDVSRIGIAPSYRFGIGGQTDVTLSYSYLSTKEVTDYGQPTIFVGGPFFGFAPVSARKYYGYEKHDFADFQTSIFTAKVDHRFSDTVSLRNTLRWANYKRQSESTISTLRGTDINGAPVTAATPTGNMVVTRNHDTGRTRDNSDDVIINQTEVTWKLKSGSIGHTVLTGLELGAERLNRWNHALDANPATAAIDAPTSITSLLNPDPSTQLNYAKLPNQKSIAKGDTVAVYAQDQMELTRNWKALLGLRWENYSSTAEQHAQRAGVAQTGPFARTDSMWSGRAGLIWQPTNAQSYYVSYGNSYNPSGELGVYGGTSTNLNANNQKLDPEKNENFEVGAQWDFMQGLRLRSALFRNEKTNARMPDPTNTSVTILDGKRRVQGIEFELTGNITPNWDIYSGLALLEGEIVEGPATVQGKTPLGVASSSGNIWTVYRLGAGWEVGGGVRGNSGSYLTDTNNAKLPSYSVFDATVAYVQKKYEVRLNLYNLADKTYYVGGYNNSPNRVLPGQPRAGAVTLRYNF